MMGKRLRWTGVALALAPIMLSAFLTGCEPSQQEGMTPTRQTIVVYCFSVEEEVMTKEIFPAFKSYWQQQTGEEVVLRGVFTGSEEVADAIVNGASAHLAILSNEQHAVWLHVNDKVETDWHTFPHQGVISHSPLIIVVRPGNPLGIQDWADLTWPGVRLVHASPRSSGGAQWALLAEYGSAFWGGRSRESARKQLVEIWANVVSSPPSSREALREFLFGVGDALVTYEQDALLAKSRGADLEIITPKCTVLSEHIAVIVDRNVNSWEQELVNSFIAFLWSEPAQRAFARYFFRPVVEEALESGMISVEFQKMDLSGFPEIDQPFKVQDLGGWAWAYAEIVQGIWQEQIPHDQNTSH